MTLGVVGAEVNGMTGCVDVRLFIEEKLTAFDEAIMNHEFLEIDGDIEASAPDEHLIKVINHNTEEAHSVTVDAVVRQKLNSIVRALETGVTTRLFGITRIVGYYSRVNNWNKSKKAELADRHRGSYKLSECKGL
ncbi:MAG TPA: hypothetical protein ACFYD6_05000 [Candidatus Brocadiia bacterium]|nr:hypothetical protein [Planctomycetota bacterium]MDO8091848.1 anaerobic ribonucleoside-triphosphate reductase [Candidatus Brocadiales bacterium]